MNAKLELNFPIGTLRLAIDQVNETGKQWKGHLTEFSKISRSIGEGKGYEISTFSVQIKDQDRFFRNMMGGQYKFIRGKTGIAYDISDNILYKGKVEGYGFPFEHFDLRFIEDLANLSQVLPVRAISKTEYVNVIDEAVGKFIAIILGYIYDDYGTLKTWKVDTGKYIVADHHCKSIEKVFAADKTEIVGGWSIDNNADGRCYLTYAAGTENYYLLNVKGMKDGSGNLISDPINALIKLLTDFTSIEYAASTFYAVQPIMQARGYTIGGAITDAKRLSDFLADFATSFDCDWYIGKDRKLALTMIDWDNIIAKKTFDFEQIKCFESLEDDTSKIRNQVKYNYRYNTSEGNFKRNGLKEHASSILNQGVSYGELGLPLVHDPVAAADVALSYTVLNQNPPRMGKIDFYLPLIYDLELGDIIKVKHPIQVMDNYKYYQVRGIDIDAKANLGELRVLDIDVLREFEPFIFGDESIPQFWADASPEQRVYGYLCGPDGYFLDGEPGKSL